MRNDYDFNLIKSFVPFLGFVFLDTSWNMENQLTALRKYSLLACKLNLHTAHSLHVTTHRAVPHRSASQLEMTWISNAERSERFDNGVSSISKRSEESVFDSNKLFAK